MTKDELKQLRHELIRVSELFTEGFQLLHKVTRVLLDKEEGREAVTDSSPSFTPVKKDAGVKGDPLAELAHNMNPQDREKLTIMLQQAVNKDAKT